MIEQQVFVLTNMIMLLDGVMIILAGYVAYYLGFFIEGPVWYMTTEHFVVSVFAVILLNNYFFGHFGLYDDRKPPSVVQLGAKVIKSLCIDFSILSVVIYLANSAEYPRVFFMVFAGACLALLLIERVILYQYYQYVPRKDINCKKILVVGSMERGKFVSDLLDQQLSWGHEVIGRLSVEKEPSSVSMGTIDDLYDLLRSQAVDEVIFALEQTQAISLTPYIEFCKKIGVSVRILPSLWQVGDRNLTVERCQGVPFILMKVVGFDATGLLYKRILDIIGGAVGAAIFCLIYPLVGLAIKLDSPGPIIFAQQRVGKNGRIFKLYKFRSMYQDAEVRKEELRKKNQMDGAIFKIEQDPRITRVGQWLRATSIDEVPQFLNVLVGSMSLVGTRPPTLDEVKEYKDWHLRRLSIKPGMTGLWQISGRNRIKDFNKIVELDCTYFDDWRFFKDIQIIFKTIAVVIHRKGW